MSPHRHLTRCVQPCWLWRVSAAPDGWLRSSRTTHGALVCLLVGTLGGCGSPGDRADPRYDSATLTILNGGLRDERAFGVWDDVWKFLVFLPLVTHADLEASYCGEAEPALAERWEHSPDYRQWTIYLRRGLRWHDGVPVTAHDIEFTIDLWQNPDVRNYIFYNIESVGVLDDHTLQLRFKEPSRQPLNGWDVFYPKHLLEALDPVDVGSWEFWTRPVGNGPYRYVQHVPQTMTELEANPDHYRGKPEFARLIVKWGGGASLMELRGGSVDVAGVSPTDAASLVDDRRFQIHDEITPGAVWLYWNHRDPRFGDPVVRRALTHAIDRRELQQAIGFADDLPITDGLYSPCQFGRRQLTEPWPYDPSTAEQLLEQAGWRDRDGNGVRERDGEEFIFTVIVSSQLLEMSKAAVFLQEELRQVGVRMEVQRLDWSLAGQRLAAGEFEAAIYVSGDSPGSHIRRFGRRGSVGYEKPSFAALLDSAGVTMDLEERDRIYRELAELFRADVPATYLYPRVYTRAAHRRIGGLDSLSMLMHIDRLRLQPEN